MSARTLTPKEIALELGTTGKTLRKFLRQDEKLKSLAPGKGGRWAIPANSLKPLAKRFEAWKVAQALEAQKRREALAALESDTTPEWTEEVETVEVPEGDEKVEVLEED